MNYVIHGINLKTIVVVVRKK